MSFRIKGLDPASFSDLFDRPDAELARRGSRRIIAAEASAYPDRIELRDARPGETLILLNYTHQPAPTPYHASHAIFVREGAKRRYDEVDLIPDMLRRRLISLRSFDRQGDMIDADVAEGRDLEPLIERMLHCPDSAYLHAHFAKYGCYAALIERVCPTNG